MKEICWGGNVSVGGGGAGSKVGNKRCKSWIGMVRKRK